MPESLTLALRRLDGGRRAAVIIVGLGALAAVWGFTRWASSPVYAPLFSDLPLEASATVTSRLEEEDIDYQLDRGGSSVSVREDDLARARVALAAEGIPATGRPGFELFDQPSWGMTDFTQRVNYRRALEGELSRTIGRMRGVDGAEVHLSLAESSFLRGGGTPGEASVVLKLGAGARGDRGMVDGIQFLVASSVEGIAVDNVTVMDDGGRLLSSAEDGTSAEGLSSRQLAVRRETEAYLETKAEDLLRRIWGTGNASVRVAAELAFDRLDRTVEAVDPESQIAVQEGRSEIVPGSAEQGASSLTENVTYETSRSVESISRDGATTTRLTVAVLVNASPDGEGMVPPTAADLARIETLVRAAVGVDDARGDRISVAAVPFGPPDVAVPGAPVPTGGNGVLHWLELLMRPLLGLVGLAVALVVALRVLGTLKAPASSGPAGTLPAGASAEGALPAGAAPDAAVPAASRAPQAPRLEVERPELTARVVRAWLKEA